MFPVSCNLVVKECTSAMDVENVFSCDACHQTFARKSAFMAHKNSSSVHNGLRRNEKNEIEFVCNDCDKVYSSHSNLYHHQYSKHRAVVNAATKSSDEVMETTSVKEEENIYESDGRIRNEISHEKERVIMISTSLALGNVQDAVKCAFRNVVEEMVPLYVASGVERMDAWNRVRMITESFENGLLINLMQDTFKIVDELKRDLETC